MSLREDMLKQRRPIEEVIESDYITISEMSYFKEKGSLDKHLKKWAEEKDLDSCVKNRFEIMDL